MTAAEPIATDRLDLVPLDADALRSLLAGSHDVVLAGRALVFPPEFPGNDDLDFLEAHLDMLESHADAAPWCVRAMVRRDDGVLVGHCGFHGPPHLIGRAEIGFTVFAAHRRRGYASEAAAALVACAFAHGEHRVVAEPSNDASRAVLRRIGMRPSGSDMFETTQRVDVTVAQQFLAERFGDIGEVAPFSRGEWSSAFGFRADGRDLVVRFGARREDYEKDRVAASWRRKRLPVPGIVEIGAGFGGAYAVSERQYGAPLEDLDTAGWGRVLPSLLDALEEMRSLTLAGDGFGRWHPDGSTPSRSWREWLLSTRDEPADVRLQGWREQMGYHPGAEQRFEQTYEALARAAQHAPEVRHVIHADLTAGNVLVNGDQIAAIFDWAQSIAGDPLYEVGWLAFWAPWHPGIDVTTIRDAVAERFDDDDLDARIRCCALHVGLDAQQYSAWAQRWDELEQVGARTLAFA